MKFVAPIIGKTKVPYPPPPILGNRCVFVTRNEKMLTSDGNKVKTKVFLTRDLKSPMPRPICNTNG